jgi:hypothetical protein
LYRWDGSLNDLLDSPLTWESEYVPSVGDEIDYCNEDETLEFRGEVVKRYFTVGTDEVVLDIDVDDKTFDYLSSYLHKFRTSKGWFKND